MLKSEISTLSIGRFVESFKIKSTLSVRADTITYVAFNPQIRRNVTITEFLPQQISSRGSDGQTVEVISQYRSEFEHALTGFLQQARAWSQIHDPQIVRVTHYFQANGTAYLVMDYEKGQPLERYLSKRKTTLKEKEIRQLLQPLLNGLRVIHNAGLYHTNLHPGTLFLRREGPPVLLDFTIPLYTPDLQRENFKNDWFAGYTPIELFSDRTYPGPASDFYALGATLYRCLTGAKPVEATERVAAIAQHYEDPLMPALEAGFGNYSTSLLGMIDWMLKPLAKDRPQSVEALLGLLSSDMVSAPAPKPKPPIADKPAISPAFAIPSRTKTPSQPGSQQKIIDRAPSASTSNTLRRPTRPGRRFNRQQGWVIGVVATLLLVVILGWQLNQPAKRSSESRLTPQTASQQKPVNSKSNKQAKANSKANQTTASFDRENDTKRISNYRKQYEKLKKQEREVEIEKAVTKQLNSVLAKKEHETKARQQAKIKSLLATAKQAVDAQRLVAPKNDNALYFYRQVLILERDHQGAQQGITNIIERLLAQSKDAMQNGDFEISQSAIDHIAMIDPENNELPELRRALNKPREILIKEEKQRVADQSRQQQVDQWLTLAETAIKENRLTSTDGQNALVYYRSVLNLQSDNKTALDGLAYISNHYLDRANQAVVEDNLRVAEANLETAAAINPDNNSITLLQEQIRMRRQVRAAQEKAAQEEAAARVLAEQQAAHKTAVERALAKEKTSKETVATNTIEKPATAVLNGTQETATPPITIETPTQITATARETQESQVQLADIPQTSAPAIRRLSAMESGLAAYYGARYSEALQLLRPLAEAGNARAQFRLAVMYATGKGVEASPQHTREWLTKSAQKIRAAAAQGDAWAQADLGAMYESGWLVKKDYEAAANWYQRAAIQGDIEAQTRLGLLYGQGLGVEQDQSKFKQWLRRAAEQGHQIAKQELEKLTVN